ncbi:hypothetical protein OAF34_05970 [Pirellulaceae bacterium]|nr:hypothetical protein [Pirellulaceae bacterium]
MKMKSPVSIPMLLALLSMGLFSTGCLFDESEGGLKKAPPHVHKGDDGHDHDGHDHDGHDHDGHDHDGHDHDQEDHDGHDQDGQDHEDDSHDKKSGKTADSGAGGQAG